MKKLLLTFALLPSFALAEGITYKEISLEYVNGTQNPANDQANIKRDIEGAKAEAKWSLTDFMYGVVGYSNRDNNWEYANYRSETSFENSSIGLGFHTPAHKDASLYGEVRFNYLTFDAKDNLGADMADEERAQTVRVGLAFTPAEFLEMRSSLARLSGSDDYSTTIYELGLRLKPIDSVAFALNFFNEVDLDAKGYSVGAVYSF